MELPELCSEANTLAGAIVLQLLVSVGRELVWRRRGQSWQRERTYLESLPPERRRGSQREPD